MSLFYQPADSWLADVIPFYWQGTFHLFYLRDYRNPQQYGEGTPWWHLSTTDLVHFKDHEQALARGGVNDQDLYVFTGSVIEHQGWFHIFYTGHNPHLRQQGRPEQAVMHAVSQDLDHWTKLPQDTLYAPEADYEPHDWRDPFVFWNPTAGEFWMLLAARLRTGPSRRRGCTALCTSPDLKTWQVRSPFWAPGLFYTHECPDLFKMGDWWYLVFSEFSDACVTRYRMSRSLTGPWLAPDNDTFDGRAYYAAKTASDTCRRFAFGWLATRSQQQDDGDWNWGGTLAIYEIEQQPDGRLTVKAPVEVSNAWHVKRPVIFTSALGKSFCQGDRAFLDALGGFACARAGELPEAAQINLSIEIGARTRACGIFLRASPDLEEAYYLRLELYYNRLVFDRWPRPGDQPYAVELERLLEAATPGVLPPQPGGELLDQPTRLVSMQVFIEGTVCIVYVNNRLAMSTRLYQRSSGAWGVFVQEGCALFSQTSLYLPTGVS